MTPGIRKRIRSIALAAACFLGSGRLFAQHDMSTMGMTMTMPSSPFGMPHSRIGSGTSWLPDSSPVREVMRMWGPWMVSLHGTAYGMYDDQLTKRGDQKPGINDWEMLMAMRPLAGGV